MSRKIICIVVITLALSLPFAAAKPSRDIYVVVLLPVEQANIPARSQLSDKLLLDAMITKLNRLTGNELIEFGRLSEAYEKQLVDDAVFELLVTDNLKHILAKLDALESRTARLAEYCKIGQEAGIDYLVDTSIQQDSMHLRVTYRIISTETSRIVLAKSFYDVPNDPVEVCDEIAKRLIRSLWKLEHNEI